MPLAVPKIACAAYQHNLEATPNLSPGTTVTASSTPHTKGSWVSLIDPTTYETDLLCLTLSNTATGATRTDQLLDIGIATSGGGSETVIVSNLLAGWTGGGSNTGPKSYILPLRVPKGVRLCARNQSLIASDTVDVAVWLMSGASGIGMPAFSRVDDYGTNTSTSGGTSHTPGNTGAESTWTNFGATLARDYRGALLVPQGTMSDTTMLNQAYHWELGISSTTLAEWYHMSTTGEWIAGPYPSFPFLHDFDSGTQMMIRAECSSTAEPHDVAMYMFY